MIPQVLEHLRGHAHDLLRRLHALEQRLELAFEAVAPDGLAVAFASLLAAVVVRIADRAGEGPIAVDQARPHAVSRLLAVLAALVLRDRRKEELLQLAVGVVAELDARRLQNAARKRDCGAKLDVRFHATRQARDVVDDDDGRMGALLPEEGEKRLYAGAVNEAANIRSYNVRLWPILQNLAQLEELYGRNWTSFWANTGQVQVFATNDKATQEHVAAQLGNTILWDSDEQGRSIPAGRAPLRDPQEIARELSRAGGRQLIFREGETPLVLRRINYDEAFPKSAFNPDPDHPESPAPLWNRLWKVIKPRGLVLPMPGTTNAARLAGDPNAPRLPFDPSPRVDFRRVE